MLAEMAEGDLFVRSLALRHTAACRASRHALQTKRPAVSCYAIAPRASSIQTTPTRGKHYGLLQGGSCALSRSFFFLFSSAFTLQILHLLPSRSFSLRFHVTAVQHSVNGTSVRKERKTKYEQRWTAIVKTDLVCFRVSSAHFGAALSGSFHLL